MDDSFLYEGDLKEFEPNEENQTYVITNNEGKVKAVTSLRRGKRARLRILHSEVASGGDRYLSKESRK